MSDPRRDPGRRTPDPAEDLLPLQPRSRDWLAPPTRAEQGLRDLYESELPNGAPEDWPRANPDDSFQDILRAYARKHGLRSPTHRLFQGPPAKWPPALPEVPGHGGTRFGSEERPRPFYKRGGAPWAEDF
jgi:hypothetical protein